MCMVLILPVIGVYPSMDETYHMWILQLRELTGTEGERLRGRETKREQIILYVYMIIIVLATGVHPLTDDTFQYLDQLLVFII